MRDNSSKTTPLSSFGLALGAFALAAALVPAARAQTAIPPTPSAPAAPGPEVAEIQHLIAGQQYTQALKLIDDALAKNPKDAAMRFRRGVTLSMLDRNAEALQVFQKLVEDHPEMPSPYNNMAVIYGKQGDYDKARGALEKAIRTNPAYATAYQNLGDVYAQLANQAYSKALQLDKSDTNTPPKLALLRELVATTPGGAAPPPPPPVTVAAAPAPAPRPVQVAAAPVPAPAPAPVVAPPAPAPKPAVAPAPVVAPSRPSPAPAPHAAAPSSPAPAPAPVASPAPAPAAAGNAVAEVEAAVRAWAAAWSRRDMGAYTAAYTPDFTGQAKNHHAWEDDRRARIATRKHIEVDVSEMNVSVNGDHAKASFRQSYQSDALTTTGRKTLELVHSGGKWLIRQESVGG